MRALRPELTRSDSELRALFANLRSVGDVADILEIPPKYLTRVLTVRRDRHLYQHFSIPKSSGGTREIDAPPKALRILQGKLNYILQLVFRPKPAVHGFVRGRSILSNAAVHVHRAWILNIDLESFFPSIHLGRILGAFMARPFILPRPAATTIAQLCTKDDGILPQGAPTSPFISNIICARLDGQLMALAKRYGLTYSRYCDDITLSARTPSFPADIAQFAFGWLGDGVAIGESLGQLIAANGFTINRSKTRLQYRGSHQEVTGITVNQFPNVSRNYIRSLRGILYSWKRHKRTGAAHEFARRKKYVGNSPKELERHFSAVVRGRLEHIGYIRGRSDPIYCKLRHALHSLEPTLIGAAPIPEAYRALPAVLTGDRWMRLYNRWRRGIGLLEIEHGGTFNMGTAFSVAANELLTAAHNLHGTVTLSAGSAHQRFTQALFHPLGREDVDAAILPVGTGLPSLQTDRRMPVVGESIAIIGFASVPRRHPTLGIYIGTVESISTDYTRGSGVELIQVSVQASGRLSGSPMFDAQGRVLGLVIESAYEATSPGVPSREFLTVLPIRYALDIRSSRAPTSI